ncbi:MAG: YbhN family protein [Desulfobulbaceae bacterium]
MKVPVRLGHIPLHVSRRVTGYFALAGLFFLLSFGTVSLVHHVFSTGRFRIPPALLSADVMARLAVLLVLYYLADGLRLYSVLRAMGWTLPFSTLMKLVFVNIFVSSVTPLATGGGVVQVYFMKRQGIPVGDATAATSIRTILAALILFTLTPIILWSDPERFRVFFHGDLLYAITGVSCCYLMVFWIILYRMRMIKRWVFRLLHLLYVLRIFPRTRFRTWLRRILRELDLLSDGIHRYFRCSHGWALLSVVFTVFFLLLLFSFSVVLVRGMGYQVPMVTVLAFQVVVTFFMYFTPTPGATGVAEGGYGLLFARLVREQDIAFLVLAWRFLTIYVGVVIGMVIVYRELFLKNRGSRK